MGSSYMGFNQFTRKDFEELDYLFQTYILNREIWLFGTGKYAEGFCRFLNECGVKVEGFVVSDTKVCPRLFMGKRVVDRDEFRRYFEEKQKIEKKIGLLLTVHSRYYSELYPALMYLKEDLYIPKQLYLQYAYEHCGTINSGIELSMPIIDYCTGIACYGCTAGAPIAEKKLYELNQFKEDILCCYKILGNKVKSINFTGGDVFLHPNLAEMAEAVRDFWPDAFLSFSINGIGLDKQKDDLWERLGGVGVTLYWTLYPIEYPDYETVVERIRTLGKGKIHIFLQGDSAGESKSSWKIPFDMKRKSAEYDWLFCRFHKDHHNMLIVRDSTIRTCFAVRLFDNLEKRFGNRMPERFINCGKSTENYLRLTDIQSEEEIIRFMRKRIDLCDYCALRERRSLEEWRPSRGAMTEWFITE